MAGSQCARPCAWFVLAALAVAAEASKAAGTASEQDASANAHATVIRRRLGRGNNRSVWVRLEKCLEAQAKARLLRIVGCNGCEFRYFTLVSRCMLDR